MSDPFGNIDLGGLYGGAAPAPAANGTAEPPAPAPAAPPSEDDNPFGAMASPPPPTMSMVSAAGKPEAPPPAAPAVADPWAAVAPAPMPAASPPVPAAAPPAAPPVAPPPAAPPVPMADPWGAPPVAPAPAAPPAAPGAMVPSAVPNADPFGVGAAPSAAPPAAADPFGAPGAMVPSAAPSSDPFGVGAPAPAAGALVPSAAPSDDPFGIFAGAPAPASPPASPPRATSPPPGAVVPAASSNPYASPPGSPYMPQKHVPAFDYPDSPPPAPVDPNPAAANGGDDDFWATMGLAPAAPVPPASERVPVGANPAHGTTSAAPQAEPESQERDPNADPHDDPLREVSIDPNTGLPAGGERYTARIQAPSLGVIFFTAAELLPSVFSSIRSRQPIHALESRPVVGHCFADSAALAAGILPGHVLLSVNGKSVTDPAEAKNAIGEASRPMTLECYILPGDAYPITFAEGMHMVKYDTADEGAPMSQWEWKPKYVVIGGIIAKPWMIMMYRNRTEYDHAVKSVMADRTPSVKIKQFTLLGAHIYCDDKGPLEVRSKPNQRNPKMLYFSIIPARGYPIKISAKTLEDITPVHSGARRVLRRHMNGGYDDRLSVGERNLSRLEQQQREHGQRLYQGGYATTRRTRDAPLGHYEQPRGSMVAH